MATVPTVLGDLYVDDRGDEGQPVAFLWPSLFNDHRMWHHQIAELRTAGWRTLALDPPGHGASKGVDRDFTMDECAQAAVEVLDAFGVRTPVVVLGTSWGGMIAPRIALRAPDRIRGLVLFNTTAESATPFERVKNTLLTVLLAIGALDKIVDDMIVSANVTPETRRRDPEIGIELVRRFRSWNRRGLIHTVRSVLVNRDATLDVLPRVQAPALVVSGKQDVTLPSIHSRRIAAKLPNARHVDVAGAAHLVPLEQPNEANALILAFVKDLPRS